MDPEGDVGETDAWCSTCDEHRRFVKGRLDLSDREERAMVPSVRAAIEGADAWFCTVCGTARRDLVLREGYEHEAQVGLQVPKYPNDQETVHRRPEPQSEGVRSAGGRRE